MDLFSELVAGTGELLGIECFEPDADGVCVLSSEEAEIYIINSPDAGDMVLVTSPMMLLPPDADRAISSALKANHLMAATNGSTISLDPDDGVLMLSQYMPLYMLTPELLVAKLEGFSSALLSLRDTETNGAGEEPTAGPSAANTIDIDDVAVELHPLEGEPNMIVASDLGEGADDPSLRRELIEANHFYGGTGGATLSLAPSTGRVCLQLAVWLKGGEMDEYFQDRLVVFVEKVREWKKRVEGGEPEFAPSNFDAMSGFLQV